MFWFSAFFLIIELLYCHLTARNNLCNLKIDSIILTCLNLRKELSCTDVGYVLVIYHRGSSPFKEQTAKGIIPESLNSIGQFKRTNRRNTVRPDLPTLIIETIRFKTDYWMKIHLNLRLLPTKIENQILHLSIVIQVVLIIELLRLYRHIRGSVNNIAHPRQLFLKFHDVTDLAFSWIRKIGTYFYIYLQS